MGDIFKTEVLGHPIEIRLADNGKYVFEVFTGAAIVGHGASDTFSGASQASIRMAWELALGPNNPILQSAFE
jgi:hypothetical protein